MSFSMTNNIINYLYIIFLLIQKLNISNSIFFLQKLSILKQYNINIYVKDIKNIFIFTWISDINTLKSIFLSLK